MQNRRTIPPSNGSRQNGARQDGASAGPRRQKPNMAALGRAIRYLFHYKKIALMAYASLFISTAAMLMVPQLVQNILDSITNGFIAQQIARLPAAVQGLALHKLGWTAAQFNTFQNGAEQAMLWSGALILLFALTRGLFAFSQSYNSERLSQGVAFDLA